MDSIYHKFGVFHKAILSSFILIFALFALSGCGYKDDPFYGDAPVKEKKLIRSIKFDLKFGVR
ncbi:LptM family lipoprotein [Campylobacter concisus]|uniref:LptM family lipoprotein n=1 Tax=Campylobacter concisus TaxID=199 RepID=UPI0015E18541|nr:hypothetical protein [Campylobacter concisus]